MLRGDCIEQMNLLAEEGIKKYGSGAADELQAGKNATVKLSRGDLTEMIKTYRIKTNQLK